MPLFNRPAGSSGLTWFARVLGGPGGESGPSIPLHAIALDVDTPVSDERPFPTKLSPDQDPVFDHTKGVKVDVTASATVFTPAAGCKFARFDASADTFVRTDDKVADDDGKATRLVGGSPEVLPVIPGVPVRAFCATASTLRITPMKSR